jgi:O-antigen ligase
MVGMALQVGAVSAAASLAALAAAVASPVTGLIIAALMSSLRPPDVVPAPGLPALLVGAVVLGSVYRLPIDRPRLRITLPLAVAGAFVFYVAVQQLPELLDGYSGDLGHLVGYQFIQLSTGFGLALAAAFVLPGRDVRPFLAAAIASATIAAVLGIVTFSSDAVPPLLVGLVAETELDVRAAGTFGNPNYFGFLEALAVTAAIGWSTVTTSARLRATLLIAAAVCGGALAVTLSRGGILTLMGGLAVLAVFRYRGRGLVAVAAIALVFLVAYPAIVEWRLASEGGVQVSQAFEEMAASDRERAAAVLAGPEIWATAPLFGVGFGHYSFVSAGFSGNLSATAAHNWYVNVLAEQGLVGIVLWLLLLSALALALLGRPRAPRVVGLAALASFAAGSMFLEPPTAFQAAALPILVVTAAIVARWDHAADDAPLASAARS